jgi:molybdopterin-guanine dinucleotide biosynthesis protein A
VPLLAPAFVREMFSRLGDHEIAVPIDGQFHHPLAAVYRTSIVGMIADLLAADRLRPVYLFDRATTCRVPVSELAAVDPGLSTLKNLNHPDDYFAALAEEGLAVDPAIARALGTSRSEP